MNIVILIGKISADITTREPRPGMTVATIPLQVERPFRAKDGSEHKESCFIDVTVWNQEATRCAWVFKKGDLVIVKGRIKAEKWQEKDTGKDRWKHIIAADSIDPMIESTDNVMQESIVPTRQRDIGFDGLPF
jgi:single-strand DNA-binding protein